jgi:hypothetical protein
MFSLLKILKTASLAAAEEMAFDRLCVRCTASGISASQRGIAARLANSTVGTRNSTSVQTDGSTPTQHFTAAAQVIPTCTSSTGEVR